MSASDARWPRLCDLPRTARLGLLCICLVLGGGLVASGRHLVSHYENRDEQAGLTMEDFVGAYHGVSTTAPLLSALERGHPDDLPAPARDALLAWLRGDRVEAQYDDLDLGDMAPAELIAAHCVSCHARASEGGPAAGIALEWFDDVKAVMTSREILPTPTAVLVASAHAHATALGTMAAVLALLASCTRWPRGVVGTLIAAMGAGLALDLASWWIARATPHGVFGILLGGWTFAGASALLLAAVVLDLLHPAARAPAD